MSLIELNEFKWIMKHINGTKVLPLMSLSPTKIKKIQTPPLSVSLPIPRNKNFRSFNLPKI